MKSEEQTDGPRVTEEIEELKRQISELTHQLTGDGNRPADSLHASRWDVPLFWHVSEIRDSLHSVRNYIQVFTGMVEQFGNKLDRNAQLSEGNARALEELRAIGKQIELSSRKIEANIGVIIRDNPILMRDLYRLDTNAVEILLILILSGEAVIFMIGSDSLVRSMMFSSMSVLIGRPVIWGMICAVLGIGSAISFMSRSFQWRIVFMWGSMIFFGITGGLILFLGGGVPGWLQQIVPFMATVWIVSRGPSK